VIEVLKTINITKRFGGIIAVNNVSITVRKGTITAIIGPNGAGKTTFLNIISGVISPDRGEVFFEGKNITRLPPHERARLGIARTFQNIAVFPSLTVFDSIRTAIIGVKKSNSLLKLLNINVFKREKDLSPYDETHEIMKIASIMGLAGKELNRVFHLTQAMQRVLDIAMALAMKPKLLLLDEPTSGLAYEDIPHIIKLIKSLKEASPDLTIILVEHKLEVVRDLADKVIVMKEGKVIAEGSYNEVVSNKEVIEAYLGVSSASD